VHNVLGHFFAEVGYHVSWSMDETYMGFNALHLEQVMTDPQRLATTREESEIRWPYPPLNESKRPNVVVIVLDDVGFGQIGCYGSSINTPHMDALAAGGIRYSSFHTTSLCSPTRASLLTGRNHHSVGMGCIPDLVQGYPGYHGVMSPEHGMLSEVLRGKGYNTFAVGKWHLTPDYEQTSAGPFDRWPLGRGFERFYGFLMSMIDHWHPGALAQDNQFVDVPGGNGYHLSVDLTDHAIKYMGNVLSSLPSTTEYYMGDKAGTGALEQATR
jgi:arylsulfatase A-like enzyme